jgi:dinuclear metal center YbgI/SA1388 family protein
VLVADLCDLLDERFPFANAPAWDPVGLQLGDMSQQIGPVAVAHEVTDDVVEQVCLSGITTLVSYHPLLFEPITAVIAGPTARGRALRLLQSGISVVVVHIAMDAATGGTGDVLLASLGVEGSGTFAELDGRVESSIGRFGRLAEATTADLFAGLVAEQLSTSVRIAGDLDSRIESVAVVPGSGASFVIEAATLVDVYVTGDVSHHNARSAIDRGCVVVDAGHVPTERPGVAHLYDSVSEVVSDAVFISDDPHPWKDVSWKT